MNTLSFLALLLTVAAQPLEVRTLDGRKLEGSLTTLNAERLTMQTSKGPVSVETDRLLSLSSNQAPSAKAGQHGLCVQLVDGSTIFAQQYASHGDQARLVLFDGRTLEMPARDVLAVRLQYASEPAVAEWKRLVGMDRKTDLLILLKDQVIDYHKGVLHDVTESTIQFDIDGDILPVPRAKVYGLAYHHPTEGDLPATRCRVTDVWGSQWASRDFTFADGFHWTTPAGVRVSMPADKIVHVDFSSGRLAYLSDMEPESVQWTPFFPAGKPAPVLNAFYAPRRDRDFHAAPLHLGGVQYPKGLAIHSRTTLAYRVPDGFRRFLAVAGIDDAVRPNGKVRLVIRGGDKVLLETVLAGDAPPMPIDLDIAGIRRLVILVDFAGAAVGDDLLLCNARITK